MPRLLQPEDFAALIGLRVVGLPSSGSSSDDAAAAAADTHFRLESSYVAADCRPFITLPYPSHAAVAIADYARRVHFNFSTAVARRKMPGDRISGRGAFSPFLLDLERDRSVGHTAAFLGRPRRPAAVPPPPDAEIVRQRRVVLASRYVRAEADGRQRTELINVTNGTLRQTHVEAAVVRPRNNHGDGGAGGGCFARRV